MLKKVDTILAPVVANSYKLELFAILGMERMRDADKLLRTVLIGCN
jgi:hypothetical protein